MKKIIYISFLFLLPVLGGCGNPLASGGTQLASVDQNQGPVPLAGSTYWLDGGAGKIYYSLGNVGIGTVAPFTQFSNTATDLTDGALGTNISNGLLWEVPAASTTGYVAVLSNKTNAAGADGLLINTVSTNAGTNVLNVQSNSTDIFKVKADGNVCIGVACVTSWPASLTGTTTWATTYKTFLGMNAGNGTGTGSDNTFIGAGSGGSFTTGSYNTSVGSNSLPANTTGTQLTAVGHSALASNTTGNYNTSVGEGSLSSNTSGGFNNAFGLGALQSNSTGSYNDASGFAALNSNTLGNYNVAQGLQALRANTTGSSNIGIGYNAGYTSTPANANVTGSNNTYVGFDAGPGTAAQLTNSAAIGAGARVTTSNSLILGDNATSVGIGNTAPTYTLDVTGTFRVTGQAYTNTGNGSFQVLSDARYKDILGSYDRGLDDILNIAVIRFNYKKNNPFGSDATKEYVGVSAQDLQKAIPEAVKEEYLNSKESSYLTINTSPVLWTLLNSVKELYHRFTGRIDSQDREIAFMKAENEKLKQENLLKSKELKAMELRLDKIEKMFNSK